MDTKNTNDSNAIDIITGDGFADVVLDYFDSGEGPLEGSYGANEANKFPVPVNTEVILGSDEIGFLSLPTGSFVTVGFTDEVIIDGEGDDIFIPEVGAEGEQAEVFVSSDLENFTLLGVGNGGTTSVFDLGSIDFNEPVRAVKIVGLDNRGGSPGFDVVNVQGLPNSVATPDFENTSNGESETEKPLLDGLEIQLQAFSPLETPISEAVTATIGEGFEFDALPSIELPGINLADVNIDISQEGEGIGSIFFEVDPNQTSNTFVSAEFNGYVFTDISDEIPAIENVTIDESTNTLGLEANDVTFTENTIEVNVESISYNTGDTLLLSVEFADL